MLVGFASAQSTVTQGFCPGKMPPEATFGDSCGVPEWVNVTEFGDNMNTGGKLRLTPNSMGYVNIRIMLQDLPRPDLVLTAWLIWGNDLDQSKLPDIFNVRCKNLYSYPDNFDSVPYVWLFFLFKTNWLCSNKSCWLGCEKCITIIFLLYQSVALGASPCAPFDASYSTGLGMDPNTFRYTTRNKAVLDVTLNFNPTYRFEGPLTRGSANLQASVPGIGMTRYRHYKTPPGSEGNGVRIPTSSDYLRMYDRRTGFETLGMDGKPVVARSPVRSANVVVIAHVDRTTHGISPGIPGVDHFAVIFFPLPKFKGRRTVMRRM